VTIIARTLADQVYEIVRERIVTGALPDDAPVRQDALAQDLGVSKIPLREALARLEQEGLLRSQANRGYAVRAMSAEEADEIYALRLAIEPAAGGQGALAADESEQAVALAAFRALDEAANGDLAAVAVCNRHFHTALVRPAGRPLTTQLVERLAILAERYVVAHLEPAGRDARAHLEHRHLIDAWMARDAVALEKLLYHHIEGTLQDLRAQFTATRT
jgi:DNA-binding GntR family transcriptional regulator